MNIDVLNQSMAHIQNEPTRFWWELLLEIKQGQKLVSSDALAVKSQGLNRRSSLKVVIGSKKMYCNLKEMVDIVEMVDTFNIKYINEQ